jgi:molybdate transport system ATP-binding protein
VDTITFVLIVHDPEEIPHKMTHVIIMKNCHIQFAGEKQKLIKKYFSDTNPLLKKTAKHPDKKTKNPVILSMENVTVSYDNKPVLHNISWSVRKGENWAVLGANGAGKSTLMHLITGDNQQSYAQNIMLFGKRKDSGISLWEIKKRIGIVSPELMIIYDKNISAYDVIISGFFDSIGLYAKATTKQHTIAEQWIKKLNLTNSTDKKYQQLSFGLRRLTLIARALVKSPDLLILDEPYHGLDTKNKKLVLNTVNTIGESGRMNLIMITHKESEIIPCITHRLYLDKGTVVRQNADNT